MSGSEIRRRGRTYALFLALALVAAVGVAPVALAGGSAYGQTTRILNVQDNPTNGENKYIDPRTGISRPDNPALNGG